MSIGTRYRVKIPLVPSFSNVPPSLLVADHDETGGLIVVRGITLVSTPGRDRNALATRRV